MARVRLYFAATICILVQLVACGQRCGNAQQRPLSFTVVNKRNTTCHWMPEVQMDAGADDPLLNGGWHVHVSLPKVSARGYGQVVEVTATKKFNEFTAAATELCGATTSSAILSLINANQHTTEILDHTTTLPTEATTSKKMDILLSPAMLTSKLTSITTKAYTTSKVTMPISVYTTPALSSTTVVTSTTTKDYTTPKAITKPSASSNDPITTTSTTLLITSTKKTDILFTTLPTIAKSSPTTTGFDKTFTDTSATESKTTKALTSSTESPILNTPHIKVSTTTKASISSNEHTQSATPTIPSEVSSTTSTETSTSIKVETLFTYPMSSSTPTPVRRPSTTESSTPPEKVSPSSTSKGGSIGTTTSLQPDIEGNDKDKIDDSDLGEEGDESDKEYIDVDVRDSGDDEDKKEDYAIDYSLNLDVKPE